MQYANSKCVDAASVYGYGMGDAFSFSLHRVCIAQRKNNTKNSNGCSTIFRWNRNVITALMSTNRQMPKLRSTIYSPVVIGIVKWHSLCVVIAELQLHRSIKSIYWLSVVTYKSRTGSFQWQTNGYLCTHVYESINIWIRTMRLSFCRHNYYHHFNKSLQQQPNEKKKRRMKKKRRSNDVLILILIDVSFVKAKHQW